jgi:hypothetical protein
VLLFVTHTPLTLAVPANTFWEQTMSEFTAPGTEQDPAAPYSRVAATVDIPGDLRARFATAAT